MADAQTAENDKAKSDATFIILRPAIAQLQNAVAEIQACLGKIHIEITQLQNASLSPEAKTKLHDVLERFHGFKP